VLRNDVTHTYILACSEDTTAQETALAIEGLPARVVRLEYTDEQKSWPSNTRCLLGHKAIWAKVIDDGARCALICEADFVPCIGMGSHLLPFHAEDAKDALGYLYGGGVRVYDVHYGRYARGNSSCAVAYVICPSVASRLIQFADDLLRERGDKYTPWDCELGWRLQKLGVQSWMPYRHYGEHGGVPNPEHAQNGINPRHQSDTLLAPLHFLPAYARGSRTRFCFTRLKARCRGIGRLIMGKYLLLCECKRARINGTLFDILRFSIQRHLYLGRVSLRNPPLFPKEPVRMK